MKGKFIECVKFIFSIHTDSMEQIKRGFDKEKEKLQVLTGYLLMLVRGIIEGNDKSAGFCSKIKKILTKEILLKKLWNDLRIYLKLEDKNMILARLAKLLEKSHFDEKFDNIYVNFYIMKLLYFYDDDGHDLSGMKPRNKSLLVFFENNSASVEVIYNSKIYKVFFLIHPMLRNLREEFKEELLGTVQRGSSATKHIQNMLDKYNMIFDVIVYENTLK